MNKVPNYFGDISEDDINSIMKECDESQIDISAFQNRTRSDDDSEKVVYLKRGPKLKSYTFTSYKHK